jgi:hypothetical protein
MRSRVIQTIIGSFALSLMSFVADPSAFAASPSLLQAKKEAELKGYIFFATHDEIVAMAKKEGKLTVRTELEPRNFAPLINEFKKQYPFIGDVRLEDISNTEAHQRSLVEIKSGQAKGWDVTPLALDFAQEYPPYLMRHDIFGMANHGVLKIHPGMIHPGERNIVSVTSAITVVPYNRQFISEDKVPATWEDFLKPEFKGRKFVADFRPLREAGLVPAWGLERTLEFARKLAAQQPIWGSGATRMNTAISVGEYPLGLSSTYSAFKRIMDKDRAGNLNYKIIEPVPTRIVDHPTGILRGADHPHVALLWFEFLASAVGQDVIDKYEPLRASVFTPGSVHEQLTRGKKLSMVGWDHFNNFQDYQAKIVAAYGFPKAEKK